jgi:hypothetical protein
MIHGGDMNEQWQKVIERRDQVCEEFKDCGGPGSRAFAAVGITTEEDGPRLIVFTSDIPATKRAIATGPGHDWAETVLFERSGDFAIPFGPPRARRSPCGPKKSATPLTADICVGAGTQIAGAYSGTVGCVVQDGGKTPYFLTAGHVLPQAKDMACHGSASIGSVLEASTVPTGLDWSLVTADLTAANPTDEIVYDQPLTLSRELPVGALQQLPKQTIAMSGAASKGRRLGTVVSVGTCLAVTVRLNGDCKRYLFDDQVIVQDVSDTDPFGIDGDSGAVAYLISDVTYSGITYHAGAAIGLYWRADPTQNRHALAPLPDVFQAIQGVTNLQLSVFP